MLFSDNLFSDNFNNITNPINLWITVDKEIILFNWCKIDFST